MDLDSQEIQVQMIEALINPCVACSGKMMRIRSCPTKIMTLYHLFQLHKNIKSGKWTSIYQGKTAMAKGAGVSIRHLSEFLNSSDFELFGDVTHRPGTTSIYTLKPWVIETFTFFEKKGMMRMFRENFKEWKKRFLNRLRKWLLPLLRKGYSLWQVFVNKLSTEKALKGVDLKTLKGVGIKPSGSSHKALHGSRSNNEYPTVPVVNDFLEISRILASRFSLKEGDINQLMSRYSLFRLKKAAKLGEQWLKNGIQVCSPVRLYQACLNKTV